jgi:hypothetical protein
VFPQARLIITAVALISMAVVIDGPSLTAPIQQTLKYWCPMHPDERAATPAACPVCKMRMVPIPPMRVGEYRLEIVPRASRTTAGLDGVRLILRDPVRNLPVSSLAVVHEKRLHVFLVGRDFGYFRHVHPAEGTGGTFDVGVPIPPGEYMVIADFLPADGTPQLIHRIIRSPGPRADVAVRPAPPFAIENGVRIQPDVTDLVAERETPVVVSLTHADTGQPVRDLEPYLGAAAHLLIVSEDLTEAIHGHPDESVPTASVKFTLTLPRPGRYRGWLQFQRGGIVTTAALSLTAR